ncbi:MAG TPA: hypothetical protein VHV29_08445 [Terriglobales bacterium]|jgi:hypothetical protein|nr:hypothetical protein [Terriglobales bacterium]
MRAILALAVLLALASPYLSYAESPRPGYTTRITEYTGEVIAAPATPVVITTSQEEGEWYKQHLSPDKACIGKGQAGGRRIQNASEREIYCRHWTRPTKGDA